MSAESGPKIVPIIDIDQTIAGGVIRAHMITYNARLELGMSPDEIDALETTPGIRKTFDVPQIKTFREQGSDAEAFFQAVRDEIRTSPKVHLDLTPLPSAQEGVTVLYDAFGTIAYYSVRPFKVTEATGTWLKLHDFPNPEDLKICTSPKDKLVKILKRWIAIRGDSGVNMHVDDMRTVLIDDNFIELVAAAQQLATRYPVMRRAMEGLVLVAYGVTEEQKTVALEEKLSATDQPVRRIETLSLWTPPQPKDLVDKLKKDA